MKQEQAFFNDIWPLAVQGSLLCQVAPEIIFAQASLESGYGLHAPENNYFGIKGHAFQHYTIEYTNGVARSVLQDFTGYASLADSVSGYVAFIRDNERYSAMRAALVYGIAAQVDALGKSGYATDPHYTLKLAPILAQVPALLKSYNSILARAKRALTPSAKPATLRLPVKPASVIQAPIPTAKAIPMSDLSVAENKIGSFLAAHATALAASAATLKNILSVLPIPAVASTAIGDVVSGIADLAENAKTVAATVNAAPVVAPVVTAGTTSPTTQGPAAVVLNPLTGLPQADLDTSVTNSAVLKALEAEGSAGLIDAAKAAFTAFENKESIAQIGEAALNAEITDAALTIQKGTAN